MEFAEYVKNTCGEKFVGVYDKNEKLETQSDVCVILNDEKKNIYSQILFSVKTVSQNLLNSKWKEGKKNYSINDDCRNVDNDMRWYAFKDYESKKLSYFIVWGKIIKNANLEHLSAQKVTLIPLDFIKENSISIEELMNHYHKVFEDLINK